MICSAYQTFIFAIHKFLVLVIVMVFRHFIASGVGDALIPAIFVGFARGFNVVIQKSCKVYQANPQNGEYKKCDNDNEKRIKNRECDYKHISNPSAITPSSGA